MKPDEMDAVFAALASEPRRRILDVLEEASLVLSEKHGRERLLWFNPVAIHMIYDRWTTEFSAYWAGGLARMKYRLENAPIPMAKRGGKRG